MTKKRSKAKVKNAYKAIIADRPVAVQPVPLGGGNPEITKVDGDGAVQAYIAAMPDWMARLNGTSSTESRRARLTLTVVIER